jgi:hypothetical protein
VTSATFTRVRKRIPSAPSAAATALSWLEDICTVDSRLTLSWVAVSG